MANIFDYLKDVAHDSFYDLPLNELDVLALTETTYLSFDNLVSTPIWLSFVEQMTVSLAGRKISTSPIWRKFLLKSTPSTI